MNTGAVVTLAKKLGENRDTQVVVWLYLLSVLTLGLLASLALLALPALALLPLEPLAFGLRTLRPVFSLRTFQLLALSLLARLALPLLGISAGLLLRL
jgi:hypothetical protein